MMIASAVISAFEVDVLDLGIVGIDSGKGQNVQESSPGPLGVADGSSDPSEAENRFGSVHVGASVAATL